MRRGFILTIVLALASIGFGKRLDFDVNVAPNSEGMLETKTGAKYKYSDSLKSGFTYSVENLKVDKETSGEHKMITSNTKSYDLLLLQLNDIIKSKILSLDIGIGFKYTMRDEYAIAEVTSPTTYWYSESTTNTMYNPYANFEVNIGGIKVSGWGGMFYKDTKKIIKFSNGSPQESNSWKIGFNFFGMAGIKIKNIGLHLGYYREASYFRELKGSSWSSYVYAIDNFVIGLTYDITFINTKSIPFVGIDYIYYRFTPATEADTAGYNNARFRLLFGIKI